MPVPHVRLRHRTGVILAGLLAVLLAGASPVAQAAPLSPPPTFTVNSSADIDAGGPLASGICQTAINNSVCTLRAAVEKANNWLGGGVTIHLPSLPGGGKYALSLSNELFILQSMTITGGGAANTIIDGTKITETVLYVGTNITATISGVTIQGGQAVFSCGCGGGIYVDAAGTLMLSDSRVISNTASNTGGGIYDGLGNVTLRRVTVSHNQAGYAGGFYASGTDDIFESTLSGNTANGTDGGGIGNDGAVLDIVNSTISNNFAYRNGAGISNNFGTVRLYNVTLAGNAANQNLVGGTGGGIFNTGGATVQLQNTLLDGNVHMTAELDADDDCAGTVSSLDYNLFSSTAGCLGPGALDVKDQPGLTGPLQANGGVTFTNALLPGSPAIDAGNPAGCTDSLGAALPTDQRGLPRLANGAGVTRCDIGAFELQRTLELPLVFK